MTISDWTAFPPPDLTTALWQPSQWGVEAFQAGPAEQPHIKVRWVRCAEGFVVLLGCEKCPGRAEFVLDGRFNRESWEADLPWEFDTIVKPTFDRFIEEHTGCGTTPRAYEMPGMVTDAIKVATDIAASNLADGGDIPPHFIFLSDGGEMIYAPMVDMPNPDRPDIERRIYFAGRLTAMRDHFRAIGKAPSAALYLSCAWIATMSPEEYKKKGQVRPSRHPDRKEVVILSVLTPTFSRAGTFPITRQVPGKQESPGTLGPLAWMPGNARMESRITDGLFAINDQLPQSDQALKRAAGVKVDPDDLEEALGDL